MTTLHTVSFKRTVLASLIGLCLSQSAFALQEISDKDLSQATGEGIAFLPQDMAFVFRGAGADESLTDLVTDRSKDTGYIHYLPVGGLTSFVQDTNKDGKVDTDDHSVGKADLYLYGLSVSKNSSNDPNSRLDADPLIRSWGSAANPWLFKAATAKNVPNFNTASTCSSVSDTTCQVTFLNFEAPLYETTLPTDGSVDAYNLKLALWADAFVRDQSKPEGDADQFKLGQMFSSTQTLAEAAAGGRANRLRLQAIWNGFSVNGSNLQIFQTLNGATNANGMSPFYNNTLGVSGVFRFNSGAADALRATQTLGTKVRYSADGEGRNADGSVMTNAQLAASGVLNTGSTGPTGTWSVTHCTSSGQTCMNNMPANSVKVNTPGYTNRYSTTFIENPGAAGTNPYMMERRFRLRTKDTVDVLTTGSWTVPTGLYDKVLRLSTQECGVGSASGACADNSTLQGILTTPALNSLSAPKFDSGDGIFIYNPNINLVLGSVYQPVILGSDGKNFSLEIARIPNKQEVYSRIYTRYAGDTGDSGVTYYGSTCNVYQCGTSDISGYQGGSVRENYSATALSGKKLATHSSISIGSVYTTDSGQTLQAFKGSNTQDAVGISFGKLKSSTSNTTVQYYYQLQAQYRTRNNNNQWAYSYQLPSDITASSSFSNFITGNPTTCSTNYAGNNSCYQFNSMLGTNWGSINSFNIPCLANTTVAAASGSGCTVGFNTGTNDLGYAPNASHPAYAVGNGTGNGTGLTGGYNAGVNFNQIQTSGGSSSSDSPRNGGLRQDWAVNAWGSANRTGASSVNGDGTINIANINQNVLNAIGTNYSGTTWTSNLAPDFNNINIPLSSPSNNLGSAVIDGLLIQHFKITTKGL